MKKENVIYCRSTQASSESINYQKEKASEFLDSKGIEPDCVYVDNGFSALSDGRPEFNKMLKNIDNIESVTVVAVDRLYQDLTKFWELCKLLKDKNIKMYEANANKECISFYYGEDM